MAEGHFITTDRVSSHTKLMVLILPLFLLILILSLITELEAHSVLSNHDIPEEDPSLTSVCGSDVDTHTHTHSSGWSSVCLLSAPV